MMGKTHCWVGHFAVTLHHKWYAASPNCIALCAMEKKGIFGGLSPSQCFCEKCQLSIVDLSNRPPWLVHQSHPKVLYLGQQCSGLRVCIQWIWFQENHKNTVYKKANMEPSNTHYSCGVLRSAVADKEVLLLLKLVAPYCHWSQYHISWMFCHIARWTICQTCLICSSVTSRWWAVDGVLQQCDHLSTVTSTLFDSLF